MPKFVVAQLLTSDEGGERTLAEMREAVRSELAQRGGIRRYIDTLKKQTYVAIQLKDVAPTTPPSTNRRASTATTPCTTRAERRAARRHAR